MKVKLRSFLEMYLFSRSANWIQIMELNFKSVLGRNVCRMSVRRCFLILKENR